MHFVVYSVTEDNGTFLVEIFVHFVVYSVTEDNGTHLVSCVAEIVPGKRVYFVIAVKNFMICCSGSQSGLYVPVPREPHQFSKGPQGNDGKLGGRSNFGVGHRERNAWIKYFEFKSDSKVPLSPAYPKVQKTKLCFIAFLTLYLVESFFSWVTYFLSKVSNRLEIASLVTGHTATGHSKSCIVYQAQGTRWI